MPECIFCKIVNGSLDTKFLYEDEHIVAFNDIHPKADVHVLVIPKQHIKSLAEVQTNHAQIMAHMLLNLNKIANAQGLANGFRTMINTGAGGGQEIDHLHMHILGKK